MILLRPLFIFIFTAIFVSCTQLYKKDGIVATFYIKPLSPLTSHTNKTFILIQAKAASQPTPHKKADASHLPLSSFVYQISLPLRTARMYPTPQMVF